MSCELLDLKAYALGEASASERKSVETHAASCVPCRTELESLGTLQTAVMSWAQENMNAEPPRRIAFVSDKIFEPNLWQRWIATLNPVNLLASAALAGIVAFSMARTGPPSVAASQPATAPAVISTAASIPTADVDARIAAAVKAALAESDAQHKLETAQFLRAAERRLQQENERVTSHAMAFIEANWDNMKKQEQRFLHASNDYGVRQ